VTKKGFHLTLIVVAGFCCWAASSFSQAGNQADKYLPKKLQLSFVYLPLGAGDESLTWDGEALQYEVSKSVTQKTRKTLKPSEAAWKGFWKKLDEAQVWKWHDSYEYPGIRDGVHWMLQIEHQDKKATSLGRNGYPSDADIGKPVWPSSKAFEKYREAVRELVGEGPQAEFNKLQGLWEHPLGGMVHRDGTQVVYQPGIDGPCFFIHGDRLIWLDKEGSPTGEELTIRLDLTAEPKRISFTRVGDGKEKSMHGIYEVTGASLRLHVGLDGGPAPKQFLEINKPIKGVDGAEWLVGRKKFQGK
jgi:uncharacterized protein (TIGR03067 family)